MDKLSDELINAWLDGEVTQQQGSDMEAAIAASPALGVRVARLARADRMLAPAFADTLNAPIPQRFEAVLGRPRVGGFGGFRATLAGLLTPRPLAMAAASLVVGVMLGAAVLSGSSTGASMAADSQGRLMAHGEMAADLASVVSGDGGPLRIRLSMVDDGGRFCRQFETASAVGLACLEGEGWVIDTLSRTSGAPGANGAYVMADGATDPAISAALQRRGVQRVLDGRDEAAAIKSGWAGRAD